MMKDEFLARLRELLGDLPQEERQEAIRYYEDYFADAGPLEETRVLRELVSPEDVAEKIRTGCGGRESADRETQTAEASGEGKFPEDAYGEGDAEAPEADWQESAGPTNSTGTQEEEHAQYRSFDQGDFSVKKNRSEQDDGGTGIWEEEWQQGKSFQQDDMSGAQDAGWQQERMRRNEAYAQDYGEEDGYRQHGRHYRANGYGDDSYARGATVRTKSYFSPFLFILALVFGIPFLCPVLLAFICVMGGFFIGFGIGGIALVAGGVALVGNALANASAGMGLLCLFSGGGLILAAVGILFIVFAVNCAFRAIPALFRGIRRIFAALRGRWV